MADPTGYRTQIVKNQGRLWLRPRVVDTDGLRITFATDILCEECGKPINVLGLGITWVRLNAEDELLTDTVLVFHKSCARIWEKTQNLNDGLWDWSDLPKFLRSLPSTNTPR